MRIVVSELDDRGFVVDQFDLPRMFDRYQNGRWTAPCEAFAGAGIVLCLEMLGGRAIEIACRVSPIAEAGIEATWHHGETIPHHLPVSNTSEKRREVAKVIRIGMRVVVLENSGSSDEREAREGDIGRVFWSGIRGYSKRVGIQTRDGRKVFADRGKVANANKTSPRERARPA